MSDSSAISVVPANRLLYATVLVLTPVALIGAFIPALTGAMLGVAALLFVVALLDFILCRKSSDRLSLVLPDVLRLQKDRPGVCELRLSAKSGRAVNIGIAFDWPEHFSTEGDTRSLSISAVPASYQIAWPVTGKKRGRYFVRLAVLESPSALGLWQVRKTHPAKVEIRVYPDLMSERRAAAVFLNRGAIGAHIHRQIGKGSEFEKLRDYQTGDSYGDIHWKASARRGNLITKVYQAERTQEIYVIIDSSRLSAREGAMEQFISAGLLLAMAAEQQGDLFGFLTFDSSIRTFLRAKSGPAHFDSCRDALYTLQPSQVSPDYEEVCTFIRTKIRKRSLLVFLTSLDDPVIAEDFVEGMGLLSQHLVLANMLRPPGVTPLFSQSTPSGIDAAYEQLAGHLRWSDLRQLEVRLKRNGVHFHLLDRASFTVQLIRQYIEIKGRGTL